MLLRILEDDGGSWICWSAFYLGGICGGGGAAAGVTFAVPAVCAAVAAVAAVAIAAVAAVAAVAGGSFSKLYVKCFPNLCLVVLFYINKTIIKI